MWVLRGYVTAEQKYRKLKYGGFTKHVYYHCGRSVNYECDEPYITEEDMIRQLIAHINDIQINMHLASKKLLEDIEKFHTLREHVLREEYLEGNLNQFDQLDYPDKTVITERMIKAYMLHVFIVGTYDERESILGVIKTKFILHNRELRIK